MAVLSISPLSRGPLPRAPLSQAAPSPAVVRIGSHAGAPHAGAPHAGASHVGDHGAIPSPGPVHDARALTGDAGLATLLLDGQAYTLRVTRAGKLILTK